MSKNSTPKQGAGARKQGNKANSQKQSTSASGRIGPFKPTINIPRMLPVAFPPSAPLDAPSKPVQSQGTATTGNAVAPARFVANDAGLLERVGHEADEALAIGKRVLTMLNVESKEIAAAFNSSVDYNGAGLSPLSGIAQGDTDSQRDGDSLKLKTWDGTLAFTRGTVDSIVSYAFVQEGPSFITGTVQVYESAGTLYAPQSLPQWDGRKGFKILSHGVLAVTLNDPIKIVRFAHKFNHDVQFYNNSSTIFEGKVTLYLISDDSGGGTAPIVRLSSQVSWVDN